MLLVEIFMFMRLFFLYIFLACWANTIRSLFPFLSITRSAFYSYRIRIPYPFQWGRPTFNAGESFAMMAAAFVALVEVFYLTSLLVSFELPF